MEDEYILCIKDKLNLGFKVNNLYHVININKVDGKNIL